MIENGAQFTYTGTWHTTISVNPDELVRTVVAALGNDGITSRSAPKINASLSVQALGGDFNVTLGLQVENGLGFGSQDDIISIIRHEVYQATGDFPSSDSIPRFINPGQKPTDTGQPGPDQTNQPQGCIAGTSHDLSDSFSLSCWFSNLTTGGLTTVGVIALIALVGIVLLAQVPRPIREL